LNYKTDKVFIISLDGATWDVLRPLIKQGYLPNLAKMLSDGVGSELQSVVPPVTAPAWTSFMTGKNPSKHGVFDFTHFDERDYSWKINNSDHIRTKTMWQLLSEKGKRVITLNLPYTYPPYEVDGIIVSGWDAPFLDGKFTYPESLSKEILQEFPDYADNLDLPLSSNQPTKSDELFDRFVGKIIAGAEQGTKLASRFLQNEKWDVFMLHFQQTDWMQHNLWVYIEEACSANPQKSERAIKTRDCYQSMDRMVGDLFKLLDSNKTFKVVLSDHGFGRNRGNICPNYYLREWGYLAPAKAEESSVTKFYNRATRAVKRALAPPANKSAAAKSLRSFGSFVEMINATAPHQRVSLNWEKTKAALAVGSETGFVYINVRGRSPLGIVEPGAEYDKLVDELISKFRKVQHPKTKEKLFAQVSKGSDIYPEKLDGVILPDIVLIPTEGFKFSFEISDAPPELSTHGNHRTEGVLIVEGSGMNHPDVKFHPRLIDLAPTILHILGLPVPADMDGRVLQELFPGAQDIRFEEIDNTIVRNKQMEYNAEETELIEQRLKGLGYIE
jgi:predicted AlkP superfamily phosphohydrolase/phosphomutase